MTSRTTITSLLALFAVSTVAAASCGGGSTSVPPPPKTTTSSVASSGGGETSAGGAGGAGGAVTGTSSSTGVGGASTSSTTSGTGGMTADPSCTDGVKNGFETDLDCGGVNCGGCGPGLNCTMDSDCKGAACADGLCKPTCTDGVKNPMTTETDVDCGGSCPPCSNNLACTGNNDCISKQCTGGVCVPATCTDHITNGKESDIDCGGGSCPQCAAAQKCSLNTDCQSGLCDSSAHKCSCPPGMQPVPKKIGGGSYCIDASEVTYEQYKIFYSANPTNLALPAGCPGAGSYAPSANWPAAPTPLEQQKPVSDVDWCDAVAYCLYSGKHLCGKIDGGSNAQSDASDASKSEWYNACSAQGASTFPYGSVYDHTKCNGVDKQTIGTPPSNCTMGCTDKVGYDFNSPGSLVCQGGVPNVWGMSGNLAEWEDSCDATNTNCFVRGGSRCDADAALACAAAVEQPRTYKGCDVGFRCCF